MPLRVGHGRKDRDRGKIVSAGAETAIQSIILGKDGFSSAISALFRAVEEFRGGGDAESKIKELYIESISAAVASYISNKNLKINLDQITHVLNQVIIKIENYIDNNEVFIVTDDISFPGKSDIVIKSSKIFSDEMKTIISGQETDIAEAFTADFTKIFARIRTRKPDYYREIFLALQGPDISALILIESWNRYRAHLIARFEDEPLFGEQEPYGVTLSQIYQPLRGMWIENEIEEHDLDITISSKTSIVKDIIYHIDMLEKAIDAWLEADVRNDNIRLISGGGQVQAKALLQNSSQQKFRAIINGGFCWCPCKDCGALETYLIASTNFLEIRLAVNLAPMLHHSPVMAEMVFLIGCLYSTDSTNLRVKAADLKQLLKSLLPHYLTGNFIHQAQ